MPDINITTNGLIERTGVAAGAARAIGVATSVSIPTRADADARYSGIAHQSSTSNPHATTASQVGAYTTAQVDTALSGKEDSRIILNGTAAITATIPAASRVQLTVAVSGLAYGDWIVSAQLPIAYSGQGVLHILSAEYASAGNALVVIENMTASDATSLTGNVTVEAEDRT